MLFIVNIAAQVITFLAKCHTPRPHDFTLVTRECSGFPKTVVLGYSDLKNNTLATASTMPFSVTQTRQRRRWRQLASKSHRTEKHGRISLWSAATKFRCRKKGLVVTLVKPRTGLLLAHCDYCCDVASKKQQKLSWQSRSQQGHEFRQALRHHQSSKISSGNLARFE